VPDIVASAELAHAIATATEQVLARMPIRPRLLTDSQAATYIGQGVSTIRQLRFEDAQRLEHITESLRKHAKRLHGEVTAGALHPEDAARSAGIEFPPLAGPRWLQFGRSVRYDVQDLDRWIDARRAAVMTQQRNDPRGAARRGRKTGEVQP